MKDEEEADRRHFILHPSAFTLAQTLLLLAWRGANIAPNPSITVRLQQTRQIL